MRRATARAAPLVVYGPLPLRRQAGQVTRVGFGFVAGRWGAERPAPEAGQVSLGQMVTTLISYGSAQVGTTGLRARLRPDSTDAELAQKKLLGPTDDPGTSFEQLWGVERSTATITSRRGGDRVGAGRERAPLAFPGLTGTDAAP